MCYEQKNHAKSKVPNNTAVCGFCIAVNRDRKNANGEYGADFIECVAWGKLAEFVTNWFQKGSMAVVVGRIQSRKWQDKNGNNRVSIEVNAEEVDFGETKKSRESSGNYSYNGNSGQASTPPPQFDLPNGSADFSELDDDDSDVPF